MTAEGMTGSYYVEQAKTLIRVSWLWSNNQEKTTSTFNLHNRMIVAVGFPAIDLILVQLRDLHHAVFTNALSGGEPKRAPCHSAQIQNTNDERRTRGLCGTTTVSVGHRDQSDGIVTALEVDHRPSAGTSVPSAALTQLDNDLPSAR
jgi:hypothetical protein